MSLPEDAKVPEISITRGKATCKRTMWIDSYTTLATLFAEYLPTAIGRNQQASALLPQTGLFANLPKMFLTKIDVVPMDEENLDGLTTPPGSPSGAWLYLWYETTSFPQSGTQTLGAVPGWNDPASIGPGSASQEAGNDNQESGDQTIFLSVSGSLGGQFVTLPNTALTWDDGTKITRELNVGMVEPTGEHQVTWHQVYYPAWGAIARCRGCVNSSTYFGAPAGTLLFLGVDYSQDVDTSDKRPFKLTYKFSERNVGTASSPKGWNYFLRPDAATATYQKIVRYGTTDGIYLEQNFRNLFVSNGT